MNTDFRVSCGFPHHHKTKKLMRRLGAKGVVSLVFLWGHVAQYAPTGDITKWDDEDRALACQWDGPANEIIEPLVEIGFLDRTDDGRLVVHEWEQHNGFAAGAQARTEKARKAAIAKHAKESSSAPSRIEQSSEQNRAELRAETRSAPSPSPSPSPSPDVGQTEASPPAPAAATNSAPKKEKRPAEPADDAAWLASLKANAAYRGVDIDRELGKCQSWCAANRKTCSRRRFVNWLNRSDRPIAGRGSGPPQSISADDDPLYAHMPVFRTINGQSVRFVDGKPCPE